uniref:SUEL-type lectin domain-containing protein n=1 Tax=Xiphophorus maculatus TaxID=8083 RepID=A0A3B5QQC8_XIPMA
LCLLSILFVFLLQSSSFFASISTFLNKPNLHLHFAQFVLLCSLQTKKSLVACEGTVARLHCFQHFLFALAEEGQAIYVTSATYGRSNRFTCYVGIPAEQTKNTDSSIFPKGCEGRSACNVFASSSVFGDPCVGTYKYLEVIYLCESERRSGYC